MVQLNEPGTVYLVSDSITVDDLADITGAADDLWNSAVVTAGSTFAYIPRSGLPDGTYRLYALDLAGHLSAPASETITIDGTDSTVPSGSVDLLASSDSGVSDSDNITNDTTPTFRVTLANAEAGDRVELLRNGNAFATPIVQVLDATDLSNGYVDFTVAAGHLGGNGVQGINAVVSDPAGNSSTSLTLELTLDTAAPVVSLVDANAPTIVKLEPPGVTNGYDYEPQIAALGGGAYAVTWYGQDSSGRDYSIFVQAFNADGTTNGATVQLEAPGVTNGHDQQPQIAALGGGAYAVTWYGSDNTGDYSIFVQAFNADGTTNGATVQLEAPGVTNGYDSQPQLAALGGGAYAVTWYGSSSSWSSIFVQAFNADGTTNGETVQLDAPGVSFGYDSQPQITAVGTAGAYAVTWYGQDSSGGDYSIFVQAFNVDGTTNGATAQLEAPGVTNGHDYEPQITAVGTAGAYAVTWYAYDNTGDASIFVQAFNAGGTTNGGTVQLEAPGVTNGYDYKPQITGVGTAGAYVVTWYGSDSSGGDYSIFVQAFNADGTTNGEMVQLGAPGSIFGFDYQPQITAVGTDGAFAVTWVGQDSTGLYYYDYSIFVQAFNADGTLGSTDQLDALPFGYDQQPQITDLISAGAYVGAWSGQDAEGDYSIFAWSTATRSVVVQLNEPGTVYLVNDSITVDDLADITGAADELWNSAVVTAGNTFAYIPRSGLQDGTYRLYAFDAAGNLSTASGATITIDSTDTTVPSGSVDLLASSDSGVSDSDNITNDTTPTFRVTLANAEAGDRVELLRNGNAFATPIVQVLDATDLSNGYVDFTVTAGHLGGNGVQGINAVVSDPAGNSSTSLTLELTLDTAAPVVSLVDASAPTIVKLEPPGVTNGYDYAPQITAVGQPAPMR